MDHEKEKETILAVLSGDRRAYARLVDAHKDAVFNLAWRMTGSASDAEDLAQEAFIQAYRKLWRFDPERRFFVWLYTITLNLTRNHLRKRRQSASRFRLWVDGQEREQAETTPHDDPEGSLLQSEEEQRLQACLLALPADVREAVVLRFYDDRSFGDIAEILNISLSASKMRVYRGLERLKTLMEKGRW